MTNPTRTQLELLVDVATGHVFDDDDFAPHLDLPGGRGTVRVAEDVWWLERAGLVRQPVDSRKWELTPAGLDAMQGRAA